MSGKKKDSEERKDPVRELKAEQLLFTLAENVRLAREAAGMDTQDKLAGAAGLARATVSQIESGEGVDPRLSSISSIAHALNISPVFLLMGREELEALVQMVREFSLEDAARATEKEGETVAKLQRMIHGGLMAQKNFTKTAAELGKTTAASIEESAGASGLALGSTSAVAAALGSRLLPGLGTMVAGALGVYTGAKWLQSLGKENPDEPRSKQ